MQTRRKNDGARRKRSEGTKNANVKRFKQRAKDGVENSDREFKPKRKFRSRNDNNSNSSNGGGNRRRGKSGFGGGKGRGRGKGRKEGLSIPVHKLTHKGVEMKTVKYDASKPFSEFPLDERLFRNIESQNYTYPTEVQDLSFDPITELRDVIGIAKTGTGKTAAFLIPIINAMLQSETRFSTLVMVPTRELALQVEDEFRKLTKGLKLFGACFIGGQSINNDLRKLRKNFDFVIGTPGRLVDLSKRRALRFDNFSILVLDEFDRMLDMGFSQDVNFITQQMTSRDQTLLFSATIDKTQDDLVASILNNPVLIKTSDGTSTAEHIDQEVVFYSREDKLDQLITMLENKDFEKVIVFSETKRAVSTLAKRLKENKFKVDEIHGDKSQNYRKLALKDFERGRVKVLVATDVAARGLDISDVTHVINYQAPQDYETYIHRIGRTGRAGKAGKAYTFVDEKYNR